MKIKRMLSVLLAMSMMLACLPINVSFAEEVMQELVIAEIMDSVWDSESQDENETVQAAAALAITKQPEDVAVAEGETAVVSFEAEGDGLTYTWYYKNATQSKFYKTTAFTGNTYSVAMNASRSGRQIYCVVTDENGNSVQTNTVTLSIAAPATELKITKQPEDVAVAEGETATVTFEAEGDGLTYEWYYKNATGKKFYKTTTFTGNTYTLEMNASRSGRQIYCVVTDAYGESLTTETVTLSIAAPATELKITKQPEDVAVAEGETAVVSFEVEGDGLTYEWYYKNATGKKFYKTTTFTGNTYTLEMTASRSGRQIYCVVTDAYGNSVQTDTVTLSIAVPATELKITKQPEDVAVAEGETAVVSFEAEGDGLTYEWYYKNATGTKFYKTTTFTGNTYTLEMTASRSGRQIYCVVTDENGNSVQTDTVTLSIAVPATELKITKQPEDVAVAEGETAVVSFEAEGDGLTYEWYYKNATGKKFYKTTTFTGNTYTLEMTASRSGRQIYCVVTDAYGNSVQTETVTLSIAAPATELKITKQPEDVAVAEGETAVVSFEAEGDGLTYEWYYKNATGTKFYKTTTFTGNTYTLEMTASRSGRQIYCVVTDAYGESLTTETVTLSIAAPATELKITKQPEDVAVAEGETATVTFEAEGDGLTYEWYYKNATGKKFYKTTTFTGNTYTLEMTASRSGRQIYCVVTDENGNSVQTDTVTLSIAVPATELKITKQPEDAEVSEGEIATVTVEAEGDELSYVWYYMDEGEETFMLDETAVESSYSVEMSAEVNGRRVYCVVTDAYGESLTTDTVTLRMEVTPFTLCYEERDGGVSVVDYIGEPIPEELDIPAEFEGKAVIAIEEYVFSGLSELTSVSVPSSVKRMGEGVFSNCENLERADIQADVLGSYTFSGCENLETVTLSDKIEEIDECAFDNCHRLTNVTLPSSLTKIGEFAFADCWELGDMTMSDGITEIGDNAFNNAGVTLTVNIGSYAFDYAREWGIYYIPVGEAVSEGLIYEITEEGTVRITAYDGEPCGRLEIPAELEGFPVTEIGDGALGDAGDMTSVVIPDSVVRIGDFAFGNCAKLKSVTFGSGLVEIADRAFAWDSSLTQIELPNGVQRIGTEVFQGCSNLKSAYVPASVEELGEDIFAESFIVGLVVDEGESAIKSYAVANDIPYRTGDTEFPLRLLEIFCEGYCSVGQESTWTTYTLGISENTEYKYVLYRNGEQYAAADWSKDSSYSYTFTESGDYLLSCEVRDGEVSGGSFDCRTTVVVSDYDDETSYNYSLLGDGTVKINAMDRERITGDVTLPAQIADRKVTVVGEGAFEGHDGITSLVIPEGYTVIEDMAFADVCNMTSVSLPSTLTQIGGFAFCRCAALEEVSLPASVTEWGESLFEDCKQLHSVTVEEGITALPEAIFCGSGVSNVNLPESLETIGERAFVDCQNLEEIIIPNGVTVIGGSAFDTCYNLRSVQLSENLRSIGDSAFACTAIEGITLPDGLETIGRAAFTECYSLREISLPTTLRTIDEYAFSKCYSLYRVALSNGLTEIGNAAFEECGNLEKINLPTSLRVIGKAAFRQCGSLVEIKLPEGLEIIGEDAFNECWALHRVNIPSSVTEIGSWAFCGTGDLEDLVMPNTDINFGISVFENTNVTLVVEKDSAAYNYACENELNYIVTGEANMDGLRYEIDYEANEAYISGYDGDLEGHLEIPATVEDVPVVAIWGGAFSCFEHLTSVTVPEGVARIDEYAFASTRSLREIELPSTLESIANNAFEYCERLTSVVIPDSVEWIGDRAFYECTNLKSLTLPAGIAEENIGGEIVANCPLAVLEVKADSGAEAYAINNGIPYNNGTVEAFAVLGVYLDKGAGVDDNSNWKVYAVGNAGDREYQYQIYYFDEPYGDASEWTEEAEYMFIPTKTGDYRLEVTARKASDHSVVTEPFMSSDVLTASMCEGENCFSYVILPDGESVRILGYDGELSGNLEIPASIQVTVGENETVEMTVAEIGSHAFCDRGEINSIVIPETVTRIYEGAFQSCNNLESVVIPDTVTDLREHVFRDCGNLRSATIGSGVTEIPLETFCRCWSLESVTLSNGLERIDDSAFHECENLRSIEIPAGVVEIGESAFWGCRSLEELKLAEGLESIGNSAFEECGSLKEIKLPDTLNYIGSGAFSCTNIRNIEIPAGITEINDSVFNECNALMSVHFCGEIEAIRACAFRNCYSLSYINVPESITFIGEHAFESCGPMNDITLGEQEIEIENDAFSNCDATLYVVKDSSAYFYAIDHEVNYAVVGDADADCFYYEINWELKEAYITGYDGDPEGRLIIPSYVEENGEQIPVVSVENYAFQGCRHISYVELPDTLAFINACAFQDCTGLTGISMGDNLEFIAGYAFGGCTRLTDVTVSEKVTFIGEAAFSDCRSLTKLVLPASVKEIEADLISGSVLAVLYVQADSCAEQYAIDNGLPYDNGVFASFEILNVACVKGTDVNGISLWQAYISGDDVKGYNANNLVEYRYQVYRFDESYGAPSDWTTSNVFSFEPEETGVYRVAARARLIADKKTMTDYRLSDDYMNTSACEGDDQFAYIILPDGESVRITGYCGDIDGNLEIPSEIEVRVSDEETVMMTVTEIGDWAFSSWESLISVSIPESVTTIQHHAFYGAALEEVSLPASVTEWGESVFEDCKQLHSVTVEEGIAALPEAIFCGSGVSNVSLPESLETIGDRAFVDCQNLEEIIIPNGVTVIGGSAFETCYNLRSVQLSENLRSIGDSAFACTAIEGITLPDGLETIGRAAFAECYNLREISLPTTLKTIDEYAFSRCDLEQVELPEGLEVLGAYAFSDCYRLAAINLPASLGEIGENIFQNCDPLVTVTQDTLGHEYVYDRYNYYLIGSTEADGLEYEISEDGEALITGFNGRIEGKFTIPDTVEMDGESYPVTIIRGDAFINQVFMTEVVVPNSVTIIQSGAFAWCKNLTSVTLSENLVGLDNEVFTGCIRLREISIPDGCEYIGSCAFSGCSLLEKIHIPASVTEIGADITIYSPRAMLCVEKGSPAETYAVNNELPYDNGETTSFAVLETYIIRETDAVGEWAQWRVFTCGGEGELEYKFRFYKYGELCYETDWQNGDVFDWVFEESGDYTIEAKARDAQGNETGYTAWDGTLIVGQCDETGRYRYNFVGENEIKLISAYEYERDEAGVVLIPETIDGYTVVGIAPFVYIGRGDIGSARLPSTIRFIDSHAFADNENFTIELNEGLEEIGDCAFRGCTNIGNIAIPSTVKFIGYCAFESTGLSEVYLPDGLETIGESAFAYSQITSIRLPETLSKIDSHTFYSCEKLESIEIPEGITYIGYNAFEGCSSLSEVSLPSTLEKIDSDAFWRCTALTSLRIPESVSTFGERVFEGVSEDFKLLVVADSAAEAYAIEEGIAYQIVEADAN